MKGLSTAQLFEYNRDGFLVLPNFWDTSQVEKLKAASDSLLGSYTPPTSVSVFSTDEQTRSSDDYFLSSGDKVRYFFESKALDKDGKLQVPKEVAINKIGHNLHELHPDFKAVSLNCPRVKAICRSLGIQNCLVPQSMLICKPPLIGGAVNPHVDGAFLYTTPQTVVGLWWPLEDCTTENGCLWAVPGSHVNGVKRRFKRDESGRGTVFDPVEDPGLSVEGAVPLVIPKGSLVLIHSSVVHFSHANTSPLSRYAYSIHVVDGTAEWPKDNWLQRDTPFPALY
jgi:phytanoyl-CoA hydroxylase